MVPLSALIAASATVALVAAATGFALVHQGAAGSCASHPFASALLCGLLVGIGVLVILPESMEGLAIEASWSPEHVIFLFLSSMVSSRASLLAGGHE